MVESNKKSGNDLPQNDSYTNPGETTPQLPRAETRSKVKKNTNLTKEVTRNTMEQRETVENSAKLDKIVDLNK